MTTDRIPLADLESSPAAKWTKKGDGYKGRIVAIDHRQQTNLKGDPLFFDAAKTQPRMQYVITIEQSNGERVALYAKGGKFKPATSDDSGESMLSAIGAAVRAAGADGVAVGAELAVVFTGVGEAQTGQNAPNLFTAQYKPAAPASVPVDLFS